MKKILGYTLVILLCILLASGMAGLIYMQGQSPVLKGEIALEGLQEEVTVNFDEYGVPHIYANNEHDAYLALGYVHAQDRLFQMEMLRRVSSGRLAEILGPDQVHVDKLFRTLGIAEWATRAAKDFEANASESCRTALHAYMDGINQYIENGKTPIEFTIIGIPKAPFVTEDVYHAVGFMAFGFAVGLRTDPILQKIKDEYGDEYLKPLLELSANQSTPGKNYFPVETNEKLIASISRAIDDIPIPLWQGSNGWVVSGNKSKSGFPILANDTHIGFSQPAVWYEAHIEYPGFSFYGHHVAAVPFGILGNNRRLGWGFTMFENDDIDFFIEQPNPENPNQVRFKDNWEDLTLREEIIKVKGEEDVILQVRSSRHGPIMNGIYQEIPEDGSPASMLWTLTRTESPVMEVIYDVHHASTLEEVMKSASRLTAPGLNMMYGDVDGNIAWLALAKLPVRRENHTDSRLFQDGASGEDEYLGYYPFEKNPKAVNPPWGFVSSTNNQPDSVDGIVYPGYYYPKARAQRIIDFLEGDRKWSREEMTEINLDALSITAPSVAREIASQLSAMNDSSLEPIISQLNSWNGDHQLRDTGPTAYYTLLANILHDAMVDELGNETFTSLCNTPRMKSSYLAFLQQEDSPWWDNINTKQIESRADIVESAARKSLAILEEEYGEEASAWYWEKAHTLTHNHPLGAVKLLSYFFNVGPFQVPGGIEVPNNLAFSLDTTAHFKVTLGPALRKVTDFADVEHGQTVSPTGQSGNVMSPHYDDQSRMFATGQVRTMYMNKDEIEKSSSNRLVLRPKQ